MRQHFCDGLEAAVKAEPYPFATTKPRTILGLMVRELVLDAARAKCAAIKLVFDYLDQAERERTQAETDGAEHGSQGNPEPGRAPEPQWDRDETTGWDSSRREDEYLTFERRAAERAAEAEPREDGRDPQTEALRNGLLQRCLRAAEADRENEARLARLAEARADRPPPGPSVPFSGNSGAPHNAGTMRIGGKLVEGWSGAAACVLRQAQHEGSFTAVGSRAGNKG
jgi:hypothetical protein